jgi:hypothetical protein
MRKRILKVAGVGALLLTGFVVGVAGSAVGVVVPEPATEPICKPAAVNSSSSCDVKCFETFLGCVGGC